MESPKNEHIIGTGGEQNDVGRSYEHEHEQQHHNSQSLTGDGASPG